MKNSQTCSKVRLRDSLTTSNSLSLCLVIFVSIFPFCALGQYDFNGDGIDELLHVGQTAEGLVQWQLLDPVTGDNSLIGDFGQAWDQLAVGNWLEAGEPAIGVITHGEQGDIANDERFRLKVPLGLSNNVEAVIMDLQRGERASVISSADLDGSGLSDVAVVRRGHKSRALWQVTLNPLNFEKTRRLRLVFGTGTDQPFTFYFRTGKESLAYLRVPKRSNRALAIYHCRLPCSRQRRLRVSQDLVGRESLKLQIIPRVSSSNLSEESTFFRRDALLFINQGKDASMRESGGSSPQSMW